jgi:hypothetical protein
MTAWYPGWQLFVAWVCVIAIGALFYFAPVARLVDGLAD